MNSRQMDEIEVLYSTVNKASATISKQELERLNLSHLSRNVSSGNNLKETVLIPKLLLNVPTKLKDWHQIVDINARANLTQYIINEILTVLNKKDLNDQNDPAFIRIVNCALRSEATQYDLANTREEYFHFLAEKIYGIRKRSFLLRPYVHIGVEPEVHSTPEITANGVAGKEWEPTTFGPFSNVSELEKRSYHQQLVLLLHAHNCQRRTATNGGVCNVLQCREMRNILNHIPSCTAGKACNIPNCSISKILILHWKNCPQKECALCVPLVEYHNRHKRKADQVD